ncbi:glycosyltransferase [Fulvivirga kasyanovii]|uniref:Glycosyltransferase family 1 protein n=1 Tax=Fulvivirga kasyanovii TaxID=396812 RepID=A0ABW9RMF0_9BACT|nr:glycosyltransferase family 4 protein [Fulvivirga kasyanovii]MTI25304.1 glycosyltransferase family 1 protein [Fulvivirga kasyanovii]
MRVLHVQKVGGYSGSEKHIVSLIKLLRLRGVNSRFLAIIHKNDLAKSKLFLEILEKEGIDVIIIRYNIFTLFNIGRYLMRHKCDIVHTHLLHADFIMVWQKIFLPQSFKWISTKHGYEERFIEKHGFNYKKLSSNVYYLVCWFCEKFISRSIAVSDGIRDLFVKGGISRGNKIVTIHHGFDEHTPVRSEARSANHKYFEKQIIIVGRLVPYKGHKYAIAAFKKVLESVPEAGLLIVGDGLMRSELEQITESLDLVDKVVFLGFRKDVKQLLRMSDLFMVPSISEGFGLVILEAFNEDVPVIAFNVSACNEIIEHCVNGILVEPFDIETFAKETVRMLQDNGYTKQMVENAKKSISLKFSLDKMVDKVVRVYNS